MKKTLGISIASIMAVSNVYAAEDLSSMFSEGKTSGQIRMFYLDREYQGSSGASTHRDSFTIGGHLKFETAAYEGLSMAAAFYTTNKINLQQHGVSDPSLLGTGLESYSILGEGYINYDFSQFGSKTNAKLGLQRYDTPMMGSDDARTLPNTFEAYKFTNSDIENVDIQIAQVTRIAYGTFSNIYDGGMLAATSGYPINGNIGTGKYTNLGDAAVGKNTNGVTNAMISFKAKNFNAKVSNDYAWDLYNTLYADATVNWDCLFNEEIKPFFAVQAIKQNSVGDDYMQYSDLGGDGEIDSLYWAAKVGANYKGFSAYLAYSETSKNDAADASYKNAIITQFGGMPAFTQGMVSRHQFLAGTKATKVAAAYSFKAQGVNLSTSAYYSSFDMDENSGYGIKRTAYEPGFDIQYYPAAVKNLQLRFRGDFPRKFAEGASGDTGWDEYRLIANYNF
jgi:hypothetical protein